MKRTRILLVLLVLLPGHAFAASWHKTMDEAAAEAKKTNKMILVDMYADWCGWCKRFEREVYPSEQFQAVAKNLVLLKLDTEDGKEGTQLARKWNVTSLPTFVILTPDQVLAGYLRGYSPANEFVRRIQEAEDAWFEFRKRVLNEPKDASDADRMILTDELIGRGDLEGAGKRLKKDVGSFTDAKLKEEAWYKLALVYRLQGSFDLAREAAIDGLRTSAKGENGERMILLLAEVYIEQENYKAALEEYKRFKAQYPDSAMMGSVEFVMPQLEAELARQN